MAERGGVIQEKRSDDVELSRGGSVASARVINVTCRSFSRYVYPKMSLGRICACGAVHRLYLRAAGCFDWSEIRPDPPGPSRVERIVFVLDTRGAWSSEHNTKGGGN